MNFLCPTCRNAFVVDDDLLLRSSQIPVPQEDVICPRGHRFAVENGVLALLDAEFGDRLAAFLAPFSGLRTAEDKRLVDPAAYPELPGGTAVQNEFEWRLRAYDLQVIEGLLASRPAQRALDIGAWNGWLSNRLAALGHSATAIDYFADEFDGLQARKFYTTRWLAIQMNLEDLAVIDQPFDVVIVNRCLAFYDDPVAYAKAAEQKVAAGGVLVLTGLGFVGDPRQRVAGLASLQATLQQHGTDFFKPMKGYLDFGDKARLQAMGVQLIPYPQLYLANLKSRLVRSAPRYCYGLKRVTYGSVA